MEIGAVIAIVGGYIVATEIAKAWFFRGDGFAQPPAVSDPGTAGTA